MHRLKRYYANLNLQNKLRFSYILLILIPVTFLCVLYYTVSTGSILDIAKKNILDVTVKNTEMIDRELAAVRDSVLQLNAENDIYEVLEKTQSVPDSQVLVMDKKIRAVFQKYFLNDHIISANIMTPRYTYGDNSHALIPNHAFYQSEIYKETKESNGGIVWLPTYKAEQAFNLDFRVEQPTFFSLVHELHPVYIDTENQNDVRYLENDADAILIINFDEDIMRDMFQDSNSVEGAFYCVTSADGSVVSHTDPDMEGKKEIFPWLDQIKGNESGSLVLKYQGRYVVVCYAVSAVTGWVSASVTPVNSLLSNVSKIQVLTIIVWIFLFVLAMVLAAVFSRRITQPIRQLVEAMRQAGKGNFSLRLSTSGTDEMQYLTEKYNEMGEKIHDLIEENYKGEIRNKESEIMALTLQLNPHFLYNTLNIVNMMALEEGNIDVSRIILNLSDMLQYTFRNKQELVVFEEEYMWLQNYLYIMQVRFEDVFSVSWEIDKEIFQCRVPKLLLQPLVENAIVHGFRGIDRKGELVIAGRKEEDKVYLEVKDNGRGMSQEELKKVLETDSGRIGLGNAVRRIQLIYGERGNLHVETEAGKGTKIRVSFPARP